MEKPRLKSCHRPMGVVLIALCLFWPAFSARGQETDDAANKPSQSSSSSVEKQEQREVGAPDQIAPRNDRLFGVVPNYTTVESDERFSPISAKGKYKLWLDSSIDPYTFPFIGAIALIGQAENTEPSYGQGLKGYAERYGTSYGDEIIGGFMTTATFPAIFHQDPRYYQLGEGSIWHRSVYAVKWTFVTRGDSGRSEFNVSEIAGNLVAAGISQSYHPANERTFPNTLSVWGTNVMWDTVANVAKEFWPDIRRKITHKPAKPDKPS